MQLLTRDAVLARKTRRFRTITLDDGTTFRVRSLNELERTTYENAILAKKGGLNADRMADAKRRLIVLTVVDQHDRPLFGDDDVAAMAEVDGALTGAMFDAAHEHCGFRKGDIEELVKNSEAIPADASP